MSAIKQRQMSPAMAWLLAVMAVREPLRWQGPASGCESAFFPGGCGQWPLVGIQLRTVRGLWRRHAIELADGVRPGECILDVIPSISGLRSLDPAEIRVAQKWNGMRNKSHRREPESTVATPAHSATRLDAQPPAPA
jgi:hypothetical protein